MTRTNIHELHARTNFMIYGTYDYNDIGMSVDVVLAPKIDVIPFLVHTVIVIMMHVTRVSMHAWLCDYAVSEFCFDIDFRDGKNVWF